MSIIINSRGFVPEPHLLTRINENISQFLEYCPDDSFVSVRLSKNLDFEFDVKIIFSSGHFSIHETGPDQHTVVKTAVDHLYLQLKEWRNLRFKSEAQIGVQSQDDSIHWNLSRAEFTPRSRVLLVDDDTQSIQILKACLTRAGCQLKIVESGMAAVEEMTSQTYDLVFLDWLMPDMNGSQALERTEKINSLNPKTDFQWSSLKMPVVTYSSFERDKMQLPDTKHFRFVDHWNKTTPFTQLAEQTEHLLTQIQRDIADIRF